MDNKALFKISYGLFVLSAREGEKDNGCIINTFSQVTSNPLRGSIAINKLNLTCEMIQKTKKFSVSVLDTTVPFDLFKRFGFQSGKDADKFEGLPGVARGENGILHLTEHANAVFSGTVVQEIDLGTHVMFIVDIDDAEVLGEGDSVTYTYYQENIKPKFKPTKAIKGWRCVICGYIYEGENLPADFICPICKHGAVDFVPIMEE